MDGSSRSSSVEWGGVEWTHQVVSDATGPHAEVVPDQEQRQEEGQHVELPVPDRQHKDLQAEGPGGSDINGRIKRAALH